MYKNLIKILNDKQITIKAYASLLEVTEKTAHNKLQGKTEFTLGEVLKTCTIICPEYKIDYVFSTEQETQVA